MASIPVLRAPRVGPEIVRPSLAFQNVGSTAGAFGEREAEATAQTAAALSQGAQQAAQTSTALAQADNQLAARRDSLLSIRALAAADAKAQQFVTAAEAGGDLSLPENVAQLQEQVDQVYTQALQAFGPAELPESDLIFQEDVARSQAAITANITERGIQAGRNAMDTALAEEVSTLASIVGTNPAALPDAIVQLDNFFATKYDRAMPPESEAASRQAGMETLATAAIDLLIQGRQYDEAFARMDDPTIRPLLSPGRARELRMKVFAGQGEAERVRAVAETKLQIIRDAGVTITPQIAVAAATGINITQARGPRTTADKVLEFEQMMARATGDPNFAASPEQVEKIAGAAVAEGGPFGGSFRGKMLEFLTENTEAMRSGTISRDDFELYVSMAGAIQAVDSITGTRIELPANIREALQAQGLNARELTAREGIGAVGAARDQLGVTGIPGSEEFSIGGALPAVQDAEDSVGQAISVMVAPARAMSDAVAEVAPELDGSISPVKATEAIERTGIRFYDLADQLTGVFSGAQAIAAGTEPFGRFFQSAEVVQVRQSFAMIGNTLAFAFREGERFADAERQELLSKLSAVKGGFFKPPQELQNEMIGLDNLLEVTDAHYRDAIATEGELSGERLRDMKDRLSAIQLARRVMGVPPLVTTEEELFRVIRERGLKPGDKVSWKGQILELGPTASGETGEAE